MLPVFSQLRPPLIITAVVTTGTATTAIITDITTTTIIIGTGHGLRALADITVIGKAPVRANKPEGLNLRLFFRQNRGSDLLAILVVARNEPAAMHAHLFDWESARRF